MIVRPRKGALFVRSTVLFDISVGQVEEVGDLVGGKAFYTEKMSVQEPVSQVFGICWGAGIKNKYTRAAAVAARSSREALQFGESQAVANRSNHRRSDDSERTRQMVPFSRNVAIAARSRPSRRP